MSAPERYAQLLARARLQERPLLALPRNFTELELQARWFCRRFWPELHDG